MSHKVKEGVLTCFHSRIHLSLEKGSSHPRKQVLEVGIPRTGAEVTSRQSVVLQLWA